MEYEEGISRCECPDHATYSKKCQAKPIEKIQRRALITVCAAFRTSLTAALEIEASVPPVKHQMDLLVRRYATNFPLPHRLQRDKGKARDSPEKDNQIY